MNATDILNDRSRLLALLGALLAGPAFLIDFAFHGGELPTDVDRPDAFLSALFALGTTLIISSLLLAWTSPVGRKGRRLVTVDVGMGLLAIAWAVWYLVDTDPGDSNPVLVIADACWPLHQLLMIVVGITAHRHGSWPALRRGLIFAPPASLLTGGVLMITGWDIFPALGLGLGWFILGTAIATDGFARTAGRAPIPLPQAA